MLHSYGRFKMIIWNSRDLIMLNLIVMSTHRFSDIRRSKFKLSGIEQRNNNAHGAPG